MIYDNVLQLIGNTPIVKLNYLPDPYGAQVFIKLEGLNPGGSMKDRTALYIISQAEAAGQLKPGGTIVESSSGNLAIGLALVARQKGYKLICVVDPKISLVNLSIIQAYGAETVMVDQADEYGNYLRARLDKVQDLVKQLGAFWPNQYNNPSNPEAHRQTTALEIYEAFGNELQWAVIPAGTCGLITGCSLGLKEHIPHIKIMAVDAAGSVTFGKPPGVRHQIGIGSAIVPGNLRRELYDEITHVSDAEAFSTTRRLVKEEGLLVGGSAGAAVFAALKLARRLPGGDKVLAILPDRGDRYYNTIFSDEWLEQIGIELGKSAVKI
ncbi:2,3-diaminopropionate biosynthesis protein SbnA [Paenibacillus sp. FSL H3-0333]|uniref:2,3-diaminopropionate biosynthesis protein SbnA n=1 Tax=Paenibacillus sp. FSL H3-0333 TaxID=2921373 RepID=UPI0030F75860